MDKNWKNNLIAEINQYRKDLSIFKQNWGHMPTYVDMLQKHVIKNSTERNIELSRALEFYTSQLQTCADSKNQAFLQKQIQEINGLLASKCAYNLLNYVNDDGKTMFDNYWSALKHMIINGNNYPLIAQLCVIAGINTHIPSSFTPSETMGCNCTPDLGASFSKHCQEKFSSLIKCASNETKYLDCYKKIFDDNIVNVDVEEYLISLTFENMQPVIKSDVDFFKSASLSNIHIFKENVLDELIGKLSYQYTSLADFAIQYAISIGLPLSKQHLSFKQLYEQTPEEILIEDQRYYNEKLLEEQRLDRKQREDAAFEEEMFRREQAEKEMQMRERELEEQRRANKQMEQAELQRQKDHKEEMQQRNAIAHCNLCKKFGHCIFSPRSSCPWFEKK